MSVGRYAASRLARTRRSLLLGGPMSTLVVTFALALALAALPTRATATPDLAGEIEALRSPPSFQLRALVPGLVQLDRGEKVKGWIVIGCEAALLTAALQMQLRALDLRAQSAAQAGAGRPEAWAAAQQLGLASAQRVRFRDGFLV